MKLNIFNQWRDLVSYGRRTIQFQVTQKGNVYVTLLRDKETGKPITTGHGLTKDKSIQNAQDNLNQLGGEGIEDAIRSGQPIHPSRLQAPKKDIDWRDGAFHRYKAQRDIVDRGPGA